MQYVQAQGNTIYKMKIQCLEITMLRNIFLYLQSWYNQQEFYATYYKDPVSYFRQVVDILFTKFSYTIRILMHHSNNEMKWESYKTGDGWWQYIHVSRVQRAECWVGSGIDADQPSKNDDKLCKGLSTVNVALAQACQLNYWINDQ